MSGQRAMRRRRRRQQTDRRYRRTRLESLEKRQLLTVAVDFFSAWNDVDHTVRADESAPVRLDLRFDWGHIEDAQSATVTQQGAGTVVSDGVNGVLYQPAPGFTGIDVFTVSFGDTPIATAEDSEDGSTDPSVDGDALPIVENPQEFQVAVNVVQPLIAIEDWFFVEQGTSESVSLDVLANDRLLNAHFGSTYSPPPELTVLNVQTDGDASVSVDAATNEISYLPGTNFAGVDTLTYTIQDEDGYQATGSVSVRVDEAGSIDVWPEQFEQQVIQEAYLRHRYQFGVGNNHVNYYELHYRAGGVLDAVPTIANNSPGLGTEDSFSTTNNQLADVDESDRIKTDGQYLYVLSSPGNDLWHGWDFLPIDRLWFDDAVVAEDAPDQPENLLTVVDIQNPASPVIVSRQVMADQVLSLDLVDDRLTIISQRDQSTVVTTMDVSTPTSPQTVSTTVVAGNFKQARRVKGTLYVFTDQYRGWEVPELETVSEGDFEFYETAESYINRVRDLLVDSVVPRHDVYDPDGNLVESPKLLDPIAVGIPDGAWLNIIAFDTSRNVGGAIDWDINDAGREILVTTESIYVTHTDYDHAWIDPIVIDTIPEAPSISTNIDRYEINEDGTIDSSASGQVPGTLQNSFSLDEHDGKLRIATENSWFARGEDVAGSHVYVLEQSGSELETIGAVGGLAPGERIFAVRFAGDRGYVVTFRQVDPLFVIDLTDATDPQVLGELKVDGYSQYLHILSDTHILGVGRNADPATGQYQELMVSLFNVSDPASPTLQDRYLFDGGRSTFSPFAENNAWDVTDHHAINYFGQEGILALPFYSQPYADPTPIFEDSEQSAVRTFQIDPENGISVVDTVDFESRADRALRIGEHLYSLSNEQLKVTHLTNPDGVIAELEFQREGADDFVDTMVGETVTIDVADNDAVELNDAIELLAASIVDGEGDVKVVDNLIEFTPTNRRLKPHRIRYTARNAAGTLIDAFATVDPDLIWQNKKNRHDVNDDGVVSALDALNTINMFNRHGVGDVESIELSIADATDAALFFADSNGDGRVTSRDALEIINRLNDSFAPQHEFEVGQPFEITIGDIAESRAGELELTVTDVLEDSRCPDDAECIWEGQVRLNVDFADGEEFFQSEIVYGANAEATQIGNHLIEITQVLPDTSSDESIPLEDYVFTMVVSELA